MTRPNFVYSAGYDFRLPDFEAQELSNLHLFDGLRAQRAWSLFQSGGPVPEHSIIEPREITRAELELAHTPQYLDSLGSPEAIAEILEIPLAACAPIELLDRVVLGPMRLATGGTVIAAQRALEDGLAFQLAGGYHHAKPASGEGFCVYNDIAVAIRAVRESAGLERVMVVDLDAHQGNGVEECFKEDAGVAVFDVYNFDIYPQDEVARFGIRWDHPLHEGTDGAEYLSLLISQLPRALDEFEPQLVVYNAGTDVVVGDPLGALSIAPQEVIARDLLVIDETRRREVPLVVTPSGGYSDESHRLIAGTLAGIRARWM